MIYYLNQDVCQVKKINEENLHLKMIVTDDIMT